MESVMILPNRTNSLSGFASLLLLLACFYIKTLYGIFLL